MNANREKNDKLKSYHILSKNLPDLQLIETTFEELRKPTVEEKTTRAKNPPAKLVKVVAKGATMILDDAIKILVDRVETIVKQVENLTLEQALEDCFVTYCMDGAEHNNTGYNKENFITYSLSLCFV